MTEAGGVAGGATWPAGAASTQRGLDAWVQRDWASGGQSTVLWTASVERYPVTHGRGIAWFWTNNLQSCGQLQSNGTGSLRRRSFALSSRGGCAASVERYRVTLSMQLRFVQPERRRAASTKRHCAAPSTRLCFVWLSPPLLLHSACCDQVPLRLLDYAAVLNLLSLKRPSVRSLQSYCNFTATRRRCSLELVQPKKASRAKPTVFLQLHRDPATPQFRTCSV